ncbi:class I SAM-dependent methyltransferase [Xenorhabdus sp. XENO-10]|uniref:Class I SAM-dependent methyltransferase n=1 Tax=Xenorhabdus yunnanensis TaxID=3025878 RepID=A0ABT5LI14_9GAMM|nr:class I SAM-dependent methyltransferase [Xenorhabdus yunnanensis]MDC9589440.1 class I SAM-dependent methyltransferase [Xenorhabdus yunnanensis]
MPNYRLDNSYKQASHRLSLLEQQLDPLTQRRIKMLDLGQGSRCLEIGAGNGSIAKWLCKYVGASGSVVATDINTTLLDHIELPNLEVWEHDILKSALPCSSFDFIHARWVLYHLPSNLECIIQRMIDALRPSGILLLEDVDFFPINTSSSAVYREFMTALVNSVATPSGRDGFWMRNLPEIIATTELTQVGGEGEFPVIQGGGAAAKFFELTAEQIREKMLTESSLSLDMFEQGLQLLNSPDFWAFGGGNIAVWGRKKTNTLHA